MHERAKREVAARVYQHGECGKWSTLAEQSKRKIKKGAVAAEPSERLDVGRPEMFGGLFVPNISGSMGSDCGPLEAPQRKRRAVPERYTSMGGGGS